MNASVSVLVWDVEGLGSGKDEVEERQKGRFGRESFHRTVHGKGGCGVRVTSRETDYLLVHK